MEFGQSLSKLERQRAKNKNILFDELSKASRFDFIMFSFCCTENCKQTFPGSDRNRGIGMEKKRGD